MAARIKKHHQDEVRAKIQASYIINRLTAHLAGDVELTTSQVQSARILLDKSISNAATDANITHSGEVGFRWLE